MQVSGRAVPQGKMKRGRSPAAVTRTSDTKRCSAGRRRHPLGIDHCKRESAHGEKQGDVRGEASGLLPLTSDDLHWLRNVSDDGFAHENGP